MTDSARAVLRAIRPMFTPPPVLRPPVRPRGPSLLIQACMLPLVLKVGAEGASLFTWEYRSKPNGRIPALEFYRHNRTRELLTLDSTGRAWDFDGKTWKRANFERILARVVLS